MSAQINMTIDVPGFPENLPHSCYLTKLRNLPAAEGRRHYVTQIKNCHGDQVGEAMYAGNPQDAAWNHLQALESIL